MSRSYFHLHLVSDATGETLIAASRAAAALYPGVSAIEHVYPLVRTRDQLNRVIGEIEREPGIVLYTLVDPQISGQLEEECRTIGCPSLSVLEPVSDLFSAYLGTETTPRAGAQHVLNAEYFKRIDALNYTMLHDDGQLPEDFDSADVILVGVSRTSKTPTSIYLANRGIKTANVPLVPGIAPPERIVQIRQNRLLSLKATNDTSYVDRDAVAEEIAASRRLCARHFWPVIDVTRRSIEETAATVIDLYRAHRLKFIVE